jgi:hypothetical protein
VIRSGKSNAEKSVLCKFDKFEPSVPVFSAEQNSSGTP